MTVVELLVIPTCKFCMVSGSYADLTVVWVGYSGMGFCKVVIESGVVFGRSVIWGGVVRGGMEGVLCRLE